MKRCVEHDSVLNNGGVRICKDFMQHIGSALLPTEYYSINIGYLKLASDAYTYGVPTSPYSISYV